MNKCTFITNTKVISEAQENQRKFFFQCQCSKECCILILAVCIACNLNKYPLVLIFISFSFSLYFLLKSASEGTLLKDLPLLTKAWRGVYSMKPYKCNNLQQTSNPDKNEIRINFIKCTFLEVQFHSLLHSQRNFIAIKT